MEQGQYGVERTFEENYNGEMGVENICRSFAIKLFIKTYENPIPNDLGNNMLNLILQLDVKSIVDYRKMNVEPVFRLACKYRKDLLRNPFFGVFNRVNENLRTKGGMFYLNRTFDL